MTPEALSFHQAIGLLPSKFTPTQIIRNRPQLVSTALGIIEFHATREYTLANNRIWWTASNTLEKYSVEWIMIALGYEGIVVIPAKIILDYAKNNKVSTLKTGRQNIRIKKDGSRIIMYESGASEIDLTRFFIPSSNY